jgi:hypothetical protein
VIAALDNRAQQPRPGRSSQTLIDGHAVKRWIGERRSEAAEPATSFRAQYPDCQMTTFEQLWLSRSGSATYRAQIHPLFEKFQALGVAH